MIHANNWKLTGKNFLPLIFLLIYFTIRFYLIQKIDGLSEYASYYFEAAYVLFVLIFFRHKFHLVPKMDVQLAIRAISSLILGIATYFGAGVLGIGIPFDLSATETIVFLIVIGPILEELIFRGALWFSIEYYFKAQVTILLTSLIFAFSHFHAYFYVPEEFHQFIYYQTAYTFVIAVLWALRFTKTKNLFDPILLHMAFNIGFYFGFVLRQ
jgi:membrane protease YdiL (CAAX protease family)